MMKGKTIEHDWRSAIILYPEVITPLAISKENWRALTQSLPGL